MTTQGASWVPPWLGSSSTAPHSKVDDVLVREAEPKPTFFDYRRTTTSPTKEGVVPPQPHHNAVASNTDVYEPQHVTSAFPEALAVRAAAWQGDRDHMEDMVVVERGPDIDIYAVFDGHGGDAVARRLTTTFVPAVISLFSGGKQQHSGAHVGPGAVTTNGSFSFEDVANLVIGLDADLAQHVPESKECGSTLVAAVWLKHRHEIVLINVGDSRAVVLADDFSIVTSTTDHKPTAGSAEEKRILEQGGTVWHDTEVDVHRVDQNLAMSRAMGDFGLKGGRRLSQHLRHPADLVPQWKAFHVLALPEVQVVDVPRNSCPWLWLASDGLWDVVKNEELSAFTCQLSTGATSARSLLGKVRARNRPQEADNTSLLVGRLVNMTPHAVPTNDKTHYRVTKYDTVHLPRGGGDIATRADGSGPQPMTGTPTSVVPGNTKHPNVLEMMNSNSSSMQSNVTPRRRRRASRKTAALNAQADQGQTSRAPAAPRVQAQQDEPPRSRGRRRTTSRSRASAQ